MAVVKNLMVRAGADFSAITKQAQKASGSMKTMSSSISASAASIKKALGALGVALSVTAVVSAAKSAMEAYNQQAEAEQKLAQVMRNTMGASEAEIKAIKELTSAEQQLGIVGDEVQLAGAQELATYLEQAESLKKLIPVMNDMVAQQYGYGASAEQAAGIATMLGKVMEGQTGGLSRYGYYFDEAQQNILKYGDEAQRAAVLAEIVEGSVGGMNYALANTPTGRMQQLSNTLGDIKEQFGQAVSTVATVFLPLLNRVANMLAGIASLANRVAQAIANVFGKKLSTATATAAGGAGAAAEAMDDVAEAAGSAGKAAKEASKSMLGIDELNRLTDNSTAETGSGGGSGGGSGAGGIGGAVGDLAGAEDAADSVTWLERALQRIKDLVASLDFEPLRTAWGKLGGAAEHLGRVIADYLGWAFDNVLTPLAHWTVERAFPVALELVAAVVDLLASVLEAAKPAFTWFWDNILAPIARWTGDVFIKALQYITEKIQALSDLISGKTSLKEFLSDLSLGETLLGSLATAAAIVATVLGVLYGVVYTVTTVFAVAGKVISIAGSVISFLTSPIGLAMLAIAALIAIGVLLYKNWETIKEKATEYFGPMLEDIRLIFQGIQDIFQGIVDFVAGVFTGDWARAWDGVCMVFSGVVETISGAISGLLDFIGGLISAVADAIAWLQGLFQGINELANSNAARIAADGSIYLQGFASGGFPSTGQLFVARENGIPEMVGTIGGQAAVANNSDIVAAIEGGVFRAVAAAMNGSGGNGQAVNIYLDGKQIAATTTKYQNQTARARLV